MLRWLVFFLLTTFTLPSSAQYNIKRLMEEGRRTIDAGFYVTSLQIFDRIVALKPNLYEAWYLMALSKYHLEDYKGANSDCQSALALQPYIADIFDLYAMTCIREEKFDSAIVAYTKALDINQDNREYWFNRAYCFYMNNNSKEALLQLDYINKRWNDFDAAINLEKEIKLGRKPQRKITPNVKLDFLKLNMLNKGSWLMQRIPDKEKQETNKKELKVKLY